MPKTSTAAASRARTARRPGPKKADTHSRIEWGIPLGRTNLVILAGGIILLVIGYVLMGTAVSDNPLQNEGIWNNAAAVTIAPILLGLGYCVVIPLALLYRPRKEAEAAETENAE